MHFRYARHSKQLEALKQFYIQVLNLELLGQFEDHQGYDGIFLGKEGLSWHLEFTSSAQKAQHHFDEEDALVFYPEKKSTYNRMLQQIQQLQLPQHLPRNPYWQEHALMIKDPDGYPVLISGQHTKAI